MERLIIKSVAPDAMTSLYKLQQYLDSTSVPETQKNLIKIRASQINGCAYCTNMHLQEARKGGETELRLGLICVWKEAGKIFSSEEQLLLAIVEDVTLIHQHGLSNELYENGVLQFGEKKMAEVIMNIIGINAWNRMLIATKSPIV